MREILSRGKRVDNGEWVEGSLITDVFYRVGKGNKNSIPYILSVSGIDYDSWEDLDDDYGLYEVDPDTIGQYTGLTDKNGKKVFEGDIIKAKHTFHGSKSDFENKAIRNAYGKEIVEPSDDLFSDFCYYYRNYVVEYSEKKGAYIARNGSDQYYLMQLVKNHSAEIIGNIHDNPELLEDKPDD